MTMGLYLADVHGAFWFAPESINIPSLPFGWPLHPMSSYGDGRRSTWHVHRQTAFRSQTLHGTLLDPPTLVSWLDYPTRIRPLGFLLGTSVLEGSYVQGPGPSELLGHRPSDLEVYVLTSVRPSDLEVPGPYGYMTFAQTFTHFFG